MMPSLDPKPIYHIIRCIGLWEQYKASPADYDEDVDVVGDPGMEIGCRVLFDYAKSNKLSFPQICEIAFYSFPWLFESKPQLRIPGLKSKVSSILWTSAREFFASIFGEEVRIKNINRWNSYEPLIARFCTSVDLDSIKTADLRAVYRIGKVANAKIEPILKILADSANDSEFK